MHGLDIMLSDDERVRYSYALTLYNITEGIVDVCMSSGVDLREYSLIAYGSAGPMLLPPIMEELRVKKVIVPPTLGPSQLSAF